LGSTFAIAVKTIEIEYVSSNLRESVENSGEKMTRAQIGMVGLGVMGKSLALNIANRGYTVCVYNRTGSKTKAFLNGPAREKAIIGTFSYEEFTKILEKPRKIILMVKAGQVVDDVINGLKPFLEPGDILVDGGNSFFLDTQQRALKLADEGLRFLGLGITGGEEVTMVGPSMMVGGDQSAWEIIAQILIDAAAIAEDGAPCVDHLGPSGAGHYVKMVHNGIEYGLMQLISEAYDVLHQCLGLEADVLGDLFDSWNKGDLSSYLIDITAEIFHTIDQETGKPVVDLILDEAQQKGTGKWTSQNAMDVGAPLHTINAAVTNRIISGMKPLRVEASQLIKGPEVNLEKQRQQLIDTVREALYAGFILTYAQGFDLMRLASEEYHFGLDMQTIARIWRAGCVIQSALLDEVMRAYQQDKKLSNLLLDDYFRQLIIPRQGAMRYVIKNAVSNGIPVYALSASLAYFDAFRAARLPANLLQAQRDYFGAHGYRRVDKEGHFHTIWNS